MGGGWNGRAARPVCGVSCALGSFGSGGFDVPGKGNPTRRSVIARTAGPSRPRRPVDSAPQPSARAASSRTVTGAFAMR